LIETITSRIMKKSALTLLAFGILFFTSPIKAQILKKIQKAAEKAASKQTQKESSDQMNGVFDNMMKSANTESEYSFTGYMVMEVTATDKKGKSDPPSKINYLLSKNPEFMGMSFSDPKSPEASTTTILDSKNEAMVLLMEDKGNKSSMALKMDYDKIQNRVDEEATDQMEKEGYEITKTGNKKMILGYSCEEYLVKSEEGKGIYWVTEKPIEGVSMFSPKGNPMVSNKTYERYDSFFTNAPQGTFMEMIFTSNDGSVTEMKVVELELNAPKQFIMSAYPNVMSGEN
jgi:hypothetical protein